MRPATTQKEDGIAVVVIDNPPTNAGSTAVRAGLLEAIRNAAADGSVSGVVLIGAGGTFIAGSDMPKFGKPIPSPLLFGNAFGFLGIAFTRRTAVSASPCWKKAHRRGQSMLR